MTNKNINILISILTLIILAFGFFTYRTFGKYWVVIASNEAKSIQNDNVIVNQIYTNQIVIDILVKNLPVETRDKIIADVQRLLQQQ